MYKNIENKKILNLSEEINYQKGQVVSKTLVQNETVSITLFAFDELEEISTHSSSGDALIIVLDGVGLITIDNNEYVLKANDSIVMPSSHPHSVKALEKFKMLLVVSF